MYCVQCGVELQKGAKACPLCGLRVYHPDLQETLEAPPYPRYTEGETVSQSGLLFILSFLFAIPLLVCLLIDRNMNGGVTWSGYVSFGLLAAYAIFCLPLWFRRRNPALFFPIAVAALLGLALYVSLKTGGHWFLPFAFPVGGALGLILEAQIVLLRYAVGDRPHRALFILGGCFIALGGLTVLVEFLLQVAFGIPMLWWSLYSVTVLFLVGLMLIIIGLCRPLREDLHKKLFI